MYCNVNTLYTKDTESKLYLSCILFQIKILTLWHRPIKRTIFNWMTSVECSTRLTHPACTINNNTIKIKTFMMIPKLHMDETTDFNRQPCAVMHRCQAFWDYGTPFGSNWQKIQYKRAVSQHAFYKWKAFLHRNFAIAASGSHWWILSTWPSLIGCFPFAGSDLIGCFTA